MQRGFRLRQNFTVWMIRLRQNFTVGSKTGKLFTMDGGFLFRFEEEIKILLICVVAALSKLANYDKYSSELTTVNFVGSGRGGWGE